MYNIYIYIIYIYVYIIYMYICIDMENGRTIHVLTNLSFKNFLDLKLS